MITIDSELLEILACPACHAALRVDQAADELVCTNVQCRLAYPVREDIPVLLVDEARHPAEDAAEETAEQTAEEPASTPESVPEPEPDTKPGSEHESGRESGSEAAAGGSSSSGS